MRFLTASLVVAVTAACDGGTGPAGTAPVSLSFLVGSGGSGASLMAVTLTDGQGNALEIESVEMVLRDIEFQRTEAVADCQPQGDDACEEINVGPEIATLPLDATVPVVAFEAAVPVGSFRRVDFEVHKLDDADPQDLSLLLQRPEFDDLSILVSGTWTPAAGEPVDFTFSSDLNERQRIRFPSPLVLVEGEATNVTLVVDLDGWFRDPSGNLIDPVTANKGGTNENLVKDNIRDSIEGFEDRNLDGSADG
jgi:hypothetical protein